MNRSDEQKARNEILFREVNERIEEVSEEVDRHDSGLIVLCECDQAGCVAQIELTRVEYDTVRASPTCFVTVPGHEDTRIARIVESHPRFVVAEKQGEAAEMAIEHDPRAD